MVLIFSVQKLSLTANGIPSRGPLGTPEGRRDQAVTPESHGTKSSPTRDVLTSLQSAFCLLSLLQSMLLCHRDVSVQVLCFPDAIQAFSAELCRRDSSLPQR